MGVIGNDASRRDVVLIGEVVERAFLLMQIATRHYGRIYVDHETKMDASHYIEFCF